MAVERMFMLNIGKRLLMMIPVIIGVVFIIFDHGTDTGRSGYDDIRRGAPIEAQEALREQMGLNAPFLSVLLNM